MSKARTHLKTFLLFVAGILVYFAPILTVALISALWSEALSDALLWLVILFTVVVTLFIARNRAFRFGLLCAIVGTALFFILFESLSGSGPLRVFVEITLCMLGSAAVLSAKHLFDITRRVVVADLGTTIGFTDSQDEQLYLVVPRWPELSAATKRAIVSLAQWAYQILKTTL